MPVVSGHFFDRTLPVSKYPERRPVSHRNGSIRFAKFHCFLACRLHEMEHNFTEMS